MPSSKTEDEITDHAAKFSKKEKNTISLLILVL